MNPADLTRFPEKILQFGTGILLRGLPDYFIDKANKQGIFNGRIVVVKSTPGSVDEFASKNCAFTTCIRGIERGKEIVEDTSNTSLSRVLQAGEQWPAVLAFAASPDLQIILSNTTEVGIRFEPESIFKIPPSSFPAKLTCVLYQRYKKLGDSSPVVVVIPTELIPDNGRILADIVKQMAIYNRLEEDFLQWLSARIIFCNSLVDRIVTKPSDELKTSVSGIDSLSIQTEPYKLWAIEGGDEVARILTFAKTEEGIIIAKNIEHYRERKLRLLNGAGTMMACLGYLSGMNSVYQCTQDIGMAAYLEGLMLQEIQPTLPVETSDDTKQFALDVLERWRNPYTVHHLLSITFQATAKMKMRNVPTFLRYAAKFDSIPKLLTKGFAAHLLFMKVIGQEEGAFFGSRKGEPYRIQDDQASYFQKIWSSTQPEQPDSMRLLVTKVSQNEELWGADLTQLPMFVETVTTQLSDLYSSVNA